VPGFSLERGSTLDVELVYKTYGSPGKPCIVHPTSFDAKDVDLEYAIGPGRILDTDAYFVVVPVRPPHSPAAVCCAW
jgi:homoserine acetyltransferase